MTTWLNCLFFTLVFSGVACLGLLVTRKFVKRDVLRESHDVAGFLINIVGVLYAVLLAFVVIAEWETYNDASANVEYEANKLGDIYRDANGLESGFRLKVHKACRVYAETVSGDEWEDMETRKECTHSWKAFNALQRLVIQYNPSGEREKIIYEALFRELNAMNDFRRERLLKTEPTVNPIMWFVLSLGAIITITFSYFFGVERLGIHLGMTALLSATIALVLYLSIALNTPFRGAMKISPEPFERLLKVNFVEADKR